ncbi:MAG: GyrI-like domain-containing protein [Phycisphaeraceae bacterium]|nr:GyrI-like domain-containing protein [Phycisphaerales bacterium]MCB9859497.1 GyrI-like domain-containing protein [Phycisphaeraceae bacterium]
MDHEITSLDAMRFVGLTIHCKDGDPSAIGALWDQLFKLGHLQESLGYWGVSWGDGVGGFHYLCGHHVPAELPTPDGMAEHSIKPAHYAKFFFQGEPSHMAKMFGEIFEKHMPSAGLKPAPGGACLEFYAPDCMDEATHTIKADLYVAVE